MKAIIAVPATLALVYRAWSHQSLTPAGIVAAALTAAAHAVHPWSLPFALLIIFFLAGTRVTKVKHDIKAKLTIQASGSTGGEGARTHVQVFANSGVASVLTLLHAYQLHRREQDPAQAHKNECYSWPGDLLVVGIIANYAAVAADTFSSELGILSKSRPRLITSWTFRKVPPGTNGGVTAWGLAAGLLGSLIIATSSMALTPFCSPTSEKPGALSNSGWAFNERQRFTFAITLWGALGSVLDSLLGGWLQQSVVDTRTGRIVEGEGGRKVLVSKTGPNTMHYKARAEIKAAILSGEGQNSTPIQSTSDHAIEEDLDRTIGGTDKYDARKKSRVSSFGDEQPSRVVESGPLGLLDNNEVNFLMALAMSVGAMAIASWVWGVPMSTILPVEY
ncbi:putative transmembrane protein 19 [Venustampulla echinocandica]|uniref:Putative transmembrane protein 19 n=1 Tax=Venustampulla echinocandica TaxID=2656787 RepID=A0A370TQ60_9HELO|nr:putative transmembrane protein 19 [Venustampulla echinocandica]RDL37659.1 putative transmembrane protein 19 [Venustampulla echinocandica]